MRSSPILSLGGGSALNLATYEQCIQGECHVSHKQWLLPPPLDQSVHAPPLLNGCRRPQCNACALFAACTEVAERGLTRRPAVCRPTLE